MNNSVKTRLSSIVDNLWNKNSVTALLFKGKEDKSAELAERQNYFELNSDSLREAELLFDIPQQKQERKMSGEKAEEVDMKSILLKPEKMVLEESDKKSKTVSFYQQGRSIYLLAPIDKKWTDKITNQKKGKFQPSEQKLLCDAVGQFLACNQIEFDYFRRMISDGTKGVLRKQKFFKLLSSVLPERSPESCYKYILRQFNTLNHQGPWTQEEVDRLLALVDKFGRKWKLIGKELDRTSDNVYDKYRSLGEEGIEDRVKYIWKISELVVFLIELQNQSKVQFLNPRVKQILEDEGQHDKQEEKEHTERRYNSKNFIFHNIEVLSRYIDTKEMKSIDLDTIRWKKIMRKIPSKSTFDCRNKFMQILQVLFRNNEDLDEIVLNFLERQRANDETRVNWKKWQNKDYTSEEARNRFMIMKKLIEGRSMKNYSVVLAEMRVKVNKKRQSTS